MAAKFMEWVERLGQQHWSIPGDHETLCGKPMLGNDYTKWLRDEDKVPCEECLAEKKGD